MKNFITLFVAVILAASAFGQVYTPQPDDPYNHTVAGVASFIIPGLGQVVADEAGRGIMFFGAYASMIGLYYYGTIV